MKKIFIFLLTIISIVTISCDNSIEGQIKEKFKEYINDNFDNPKLVKEIVSIEPYDTISNKKFIKLIINSINAVKCLDEKSDSIMNTLSDKNVTSKIIEAKSKGEYYTHTEKIAEGLKELLYYVKNYEIYRIGNKEKLTKFISDTSALAKIDMIIYKIKYRIKDKDSLVLNEAYGVFDRTIINNNITIRIDEIKKKELPEQFLEITNALDSYLKLTQDKQNIYNKIFNNYNTLKVLLQK